jgi:pyrimidine-nucleoside phosphorylase
MDAEGVGLASLSLGAGRSTKEDVIDPAAGIMLEAKTGDCVESGSLLATLYAASEELLDEGERRLRASYTLGDRQPEPVPHFFARVSRNGVERLG